MVKLDPDIAQICLENWVDEIRQWPLAGFGVDCVQKLIVRRVSWRQFRLSLRPLTLVVALDNHPIRKQQTHCSFPD
jgi:hypothetical protein